MDADYACKVKEEEIVMKDNCNSSLNKENLKISFYTTTEDDKKDEVEFQFEEGFDYDEGECPMSEDSDNDERSLQKQSTFSRHESKFRSNLDQTEMKSEMKQEDESPEHKDGEDWIINLHKSLPTLDSSSSSVVGDIVDVGFAPLTQSPLPRQAPSSSSPDQGVAGNCSTSRDSSGRLMEVTRIQPKPQFRVLPKICPMCSKCYGVNFARHVSHNCRRSMKKEHATNFNQQLNINMTGKSVLHEDEIKNFVTAANLESTFVPHFCEFARRLGHIVLDNQTQWPLLAPVKVEPLGATWKEVSFLVNDNMMIGNLSCEKPKIASTPLSILPSEKGKSKECEINIYEYYENYMNYLCKQE